MTWTDGGNLRVEEGGYPERNREIHLQMEREKAENRRTVRRVIGRIALGLSGMLFAVSILAGVLIPVIFDSVTDGEWDINVMIVASALILYSVGIITYIVLRRWVPDASQLAVKLPWQDGYSGPPQWQAPPGQPGHSGPPQWQAPPGQQGHSGPPQWQAPPGQPGHSGQPRWQASPGQPGHSGPPQWQAPPGQQGHSGQPRWQAPPGQPEHRGQPQWQAPPGQQGQSGQPQWQAPPEQPGHSGQPQWQAPPGQQGHSGPPQWQAPPGQPGHSGQPRWQASPGQQGHSGQPQWQAPPDQQGHSGQPQWQAPPGQQGHSGQPRWQAPPGQPGHSGQPQWQAPSGQQGHSGQPQWQVPHPRQGYSDQAQWQVPPPRQGYSSQVQQLAPPPPRKLTFGMGCKLVLICLTVGAALNFITMGISYLVSFLGHAREVREISQQYLETGYGVIPEPPIFFEIDPLMDMIGGLNPILSILIIVVTTSIFEEMIFRKLLYDKLIVFGGKVFIFVSSLLFALFHVNHHQLLYTFGVGVIFAGVMYYTQKVSYCILLHMAFNLSGTIALHMQEMPEEVLMVYGVVYFGLLVAGIVFITLGLLSVKQWATFEPAQIEVKKRMDIFLNPGMIIFIIITVTSMIGGAMYFAGS